MPTLSRSRWLLLFVALFALLPARAAWADLRLHSLFSDRMVMQREMPVPVWGWAAPGEEVTVSMGDATVKTTADPKGSWRVNLPAMEAGGPHKLTVAGKNTLTVNDVLVGEVWVCIGQSNMQVTLGHSHLAGQDVPKAGDPQLRLGSMRAGVVACQPKLDAGFQWTESTPGSASGYSAVAYYFGRELREKLGVPVGLIQQSMGATDIECWTPAIGSEIVPSQAKFVRMVEQVEADYQRLREESLDAWTELAREAIANEENLPPLPPAVDNRMVQRGWMPLGLYNGMIHPMVGYGIRGAIWYQGEANNGEGMEYYDKLRALIGGWRKAWGQGDFPFYYVQIAPWAGYPEGAIEGLWEAQTAALAIPQTGMAVISDLVPNIHDIHPNQKMEVGRRLGLWALAKTYGDDDLVYSGPLMKSATIDGDAIRVEFDHVGSGLTTRDDKPVDYFQIGTPAGFVDAEARIDGDAVIVRSDEVSQPKYVRFAWKNIAQPNLINKEGLPASPFRTDCCPVSFSTGSQFAKRHQVELTTDPIEGVIHYTLDGSMPTEDSPVYDGPIEIDATTTINARFFAADGRSSLTTSQTYAQVDPVMLDERVLAPGVDYEFYIGRWVRMPDFDAMNADRQGMLDSATPTNHSESFLSAHRFQGYLNLPADGKYTFTMTEHDRPMSGSLAEADLTIDGKLVVGSEVQGQAPAALATGRKVRVRLEGDERLLCLAEVQVFEAGTGAQLQTAGTASQSSVGYGCPAARASDGNPNSSFFGNSLSHTETEANPWWSVDLGGDKAIGQIKIFNRGDCCGERLEGAIVEVLDGGDQVVWKTKINTVNTGSVHDFDAKGAIEFSAGLHPFVLTYHEGGGPPGLKVLYEGPGIERQEVPASMYLREEDQ